MATFVVYEKLNQKQAQYCYDGIRKFFKDNPDRYDVLTQSFTVRRGHLKEDILANSQDGVKLKEEVQNKEFVIVNKKKKAVAAGKKKKPAKKKTIKKSTKKKTVKKKSRRA